MYLSVRDICVHPGMELATISRSSIRLRSVDSSLRFTVIRMGSNMSDPASDTDLLLERARKGDQQAVALLFDRHRARLRHMVRLRLDRRLQGRVDPSDVLQEAYL